jgi:hypothetical protein
MSTLGALSCRRSSLALVQVWLPPRPAPSRLRPGAALNPGAARPDDGGTAHEPASHPAGPRYLSSQSRTSCVSTSFGGT